MRWQITLPQHKISLKKSYCFAQASMQVVCVNKLRASVLPLFITRLGPPKFLIALLLFFREK
jgi:hypothetical protein